MLLSCKKPGEATELTFEILNHQIKQTILEEHFCLLASTLGTILRAVKKPYRAPSSLIIVT